MMIICPATGLECKSSGCTSGLRSCDHWPKAIPTNDRYSDGFKAGREAGMREAARIAKKYEPDERHPSVRYPSDDILSAIDK